MTYRTGTSINESDQPRLDASVRRGLGLLALVAVVASMVFASSEALDVPAAGAALPDAPAVTRAAPLGRVTAPPAAVPAPDFDPATLRPQQPAVGMPEHG